MTLPRLLQRTALTGCALAMLLGGGSGGSPEPTRRPASAAELVDPRGCLAIDAPAASSQTGLSVTDGLGRRRSFDLLLSPGYRPGRPAAVLLLLHGRGGTSRDGWMLEFAEVAASREAEVIVVMPQGVEVDGQGIGWDQACDGPDMVMFDRLIQAVSARVCVDPGRLMAAGFSWGADMVDALACCRGQLLRGVASFSGDEVDANPVCRSRARPAAWLRYGTSRGAGGDGVYTRQQFRAAVDFFRQGQSCSAESVPVAPEPCRSFVGCTAPVVACERSDLAHEVPTRPELEAAWRFLDALR